MWFPVSKMHQVSISLVTCCLLLCLAPSLSYRRMRISFPIPIFNYSLDYSTGLKIESVNSVDVVDTASSDGSSKPLLTIMKDPPKNRMDYRLPKTLRPLHYDIKVQPFINGNYSIHGSVDIEFEVLETTSTITLHALDVDIELSTVKLIPADDGEGGPGPKRKPTRKGRPKLKERSSPAMTHFTVDKIRQFFVVHLNGSLQRGRRFHCSMDYIAWLHMNTGFFGSKYNDSFNVERYGKEASLASEWNILSTLFQPTFARQAFPCFDEPALKATFRLHVVREKNMTAISNMPLHNTTSIEDQDGWVVDHFEISPPMSTYLLILTVSQLEYVNITGHGDLPIRVWARPEVLHHTALAQEAIPKILAFYEQYLNISYSLPKLDFVAVPTKFPIAFEGWGIILSYDEVFLLHNQDTDDENRKKLIIEVQSHEIAHQWFGDLITPKWWNSLWLSEGFASYLHHLAADNLAYLNETTLKGRVDLVQEMLQRDSSNSHPINLPVFSPKEIHEIFDDISYYKGFCLIHMMNSFLSQETFRKGIIDFLRTWKHKSVGQDELWQHLTKAAHEDGILPPKVTVKMIMNSWTLQTGYPVIKVIRSPDGTSATVYQEKFLLSKENSTDTHFYKWWVPLTYTGQDRPNFGNTSIKAWIKDSETQTRLYSLPSKDHWVIFNLQEANFYRVNYDEHNWNLLTHQLQNDHKAIHLSNRAQLIDDVLNLALAGKLSYKIAFDMTEYLAKEEEMLVWKAAFNNIEHIQSLLKDTPAYTSIQKYLLSMLAPLYNVMGLRNGMVQEIKKEHSETVKWACNLGHPDCIHLAKSLYWQWMRNPEDIKLASVDVRETVYCTAIAYGGEAEWQFAWSQYFNTNDNQHKDQILRALSCSKDPDTKAGYLDMAFTLGVNLRQKDPFQVFSSVASQVQGQHIAWNFLLKNWENITTMFGKDDAVVNDFLMTATKFFKSKNDLTELKVFVKTIRNQPSIVRASESVMHQTNFNIAWMERNYDTVCKWLSDHGFPTKLHTI